MISFGNSSAEPATFDVPSFYRQHLVTVHSFMVFVEMARRDTAADLRLLADKVAAGELDTGDLAHRELDRGRRRARGAGRAPGQRQGRADRRLSGLRRHRPDRDHVGDAPAPRTRLAATRTPITGGRARPRRRPPARAAGPTPAMIVAISRKSRPAVGDPEADPDPGRVAGGLVEALLRVDPLGGRRASRCSRGSRRRAAP